MCEHKRLTVRDTREPRPQGQRRGPPATGAAHGPRVAELVAQLRAMPPEPSDLTDEERGAVRRALAAGVVTVPGFGLRLSIALARRRLQAELEEARAGGRPQASALSRNDPPALVSTGPPR
jgi:hypothetical protein